MKPKINKVCHESKDNSIVSLFSKGSEHPNSNSKIVLKDNNYSDI